MDSVATDSQLWDDAADFTAAEVSEYRSTMFPAALGNPANSPFFSLENAPAWMTPRGYGLYNDYSPMEPQILRFGVAYATIRQLRAYREHVVGPAYLSHSFFELGSHGNWISPGPFNAWMRIMHEQAERGRTLHRVEPGPARNQTPASVGSPPRSRTMSRSSYSSSRQSPPPSRSASAHSVESWHSRWAYTPDSAHSSRASSPAPSRAVSQGRSNTSSRAPSLAPPPPRAPSPWPVSMLSGLDDAPPAPHIPDTSQSASTPEPSAPRPKKGKGKTKAGRPPIRITRELYVHRVETVTTAARTWSIPREEVVYLLDLSATPDVLKKNGKPRSIDSFIKAEDQDAWEGSSGHKNGDVWVYAFSGEQVRARRAQLQCKGVNVCEYMSEEVFGDCERYEPDVSAMQDLWIHELDANKREAASPDAILSRFYTRVIQSKCKVECEGVPALILRASGPNQYGKLYFPMPANVDEDQFKFVLENDGRLPEGVASSFNEKCVLTTHPRLGLTNCCFSHIIDGVIHPAKLRQRQCDSELIVFIPVPPSDKFRYKWEPEYEFQAILHFRNAHNHPVHPETKPSMADEQLLESAMDAFGTQNLTVENLLNAQSTSVVYGGQRVSAVSPAFADVRKVRDAIAARRKMEFPGGTDFAGVQHYIRAIEQARPTSERYIHAAISKGDFNVVVTLHPQLAKFIHGVLALVIDFTFKRIEGDFDEWEVVGFSDRLESRLSFSSFYCDRKTVPAFAQLFEEFFDAVFHVTGEKLRLRPFYPDANCRVFVMDGEVAQVQGFAEFLAKYNVPSISGIHERDGMAMVDTSLKTCTLHFQRHIDELETKHKVPHPIVLRLKSIMGVKTQAEVDEWHRFCAAQTLPPVKNWYAQKLANPWYIPSVCPFLSRIDPADHKITPNTTNLAESSHSGVNARTAIRLSLLEGILSKKKEDETQVDKLMQSVSTGVMRKRWNGIGQREKLSAQRHTWGAHKASERNEHLQLFDELRAEREEGQVEWQFSLSRQKVIQAEIDELRAQLKVDGRRTDLKQEMKILRLDISSQAHARREWVKRRGEIDDQLRELRSGPLKGVQINGRRMGDAETSVESEADVTDSNPGLHDAPETATNEESVLSDPATQTMTANNESSASDLNSPLFNHNNTSESYWDSSIVLDPELEPNYTVLRGGMDWEATLPETVGSNTSSAGPAHTPATPAAVAAPNTAGNVNAAHPSAASLQVAGPAGAVANAVPRRRRASLDLSNIVEGTRERRQTKRAKGDDSL
ncbi:hypothetical protein FB45DRAFT_1026254 [Roridomyces roridus]|uniref:Uncharacterized protein n=1 Tax=Roridomyces roridus TaxID=1738132 RepID=A0AAD7C0H3_9AGAR|nr:hypothetical protein FB45DRAFT_1026254 [Roridomyces roridus]